MKIYLIRHGQAAASWDQDRDPGLSALGAKQALQLTDRMTPRLSAEITIISSPLKRAQETAAPLSEKLGRKVTIENTFREVPSPAALDDRPAWLHEMMQRRWPEQPDDLHHWRDAIMCALQESKSECIIFSHFMVINAVISKLTDREETVCFYPDYVSVTHIENTEGILKLIDAGTEMETVIN